MKKALSGIVWIGLVAVLLGAGTLVHVPDVLAGDLYRLDMRCEGPEPTYPTHIVLNVYHREDELRGTAEADFDGAVLSNVVCDDVVCITDAAGAGGALVVWYSVAGYDRGKFKAHTRFDLTSGRGRKFVDLHTSCSRPIYMHVPYAGDPDGTFFIEGGDGDCLWNPGDCPEGSKLYALEGEFRVPSTAPGRLTFNLYKGDHDLKGTSTVSFSGMGPEDVVCDPVACITDVYVERSEAVVAFKARGFKGGSGEFERDSRFELETSEAGAFFLDLHTSCSRAIQVDVPLDMSPGGSVTFTNGCGGCLGAPGGECPSSDKLYWVDARFRVPCASPGALTLNVYKDDDELKGTSTASFDGVSLTSVTCDVVACITEAQMSGGDMLVTFRANGAKDDGKFDANSRFELEIAGCGTFFRDQHTSCSQPILQNFPYEVAPGGTLIITGGCGCLESVPTAVKASSWSVIKKMYR